MRQKTSQRRNSAAELLKLRLNRYSDTVAGKAAYLISHLLKGDLPTHMGFACTELGEEAFKNYYGADIDRVIELCGKLESDDPNQSCLAVIAAAEDMGCDDCLRNNYYRLYDAGIPELIIEFYGGFRGQIVKIYPLADNRHVIQAVSDDGVRKFYFSGDPTFVFNEFDHAAIFGMFGKDHFRTVIKLHDAVKTP